MTQHEYLDIQIYKHNQLTFSNHTIICSTNNTNTYCKKPILPIPEPESGGDGPPPPPGRKGITAGINFDYGWS